MHASDRFRRTADNCLYCIAELTPYFRGKIMQDLTKADIYRYIKWRRPRNKRYKDRPVANATMRRELSVLSVAINFVNERLDWGFLTQCCADARKLPTAGFAGYFRKKPPR